MRSWLLGGLLVLGVTPVNALLFMYAAKHGVRGLMLLSLAWALVPVAMMLVGVHRGGRAGREAPYSRD